MAKSKNPKKSKSSPKETPKGERASSVLIEAGLRLVDKEIDELKSLVPEISPDPDLDKLVHEAQFIVIAKGLDPKFYSEESLRRWLWGERSKKTSNWDSSPDFDHLRTLFKWNESKFFEMLFGMTSNGLFNMLLIDRSCPSFERVVYSPKPYSPQNKKTWELDYKYHPLIKDWYLTAKIAEKKLRERLHTGLSKIPGLFWEKEEGFTFVVKDFAPWLIEVGIINWLKGEGCKIPEGLKGFLEIWKGSEATVTPAKGEGDKSRKTKKVKKKNPGGSPSPAKKDGVRRLKALFKKREFKKLNKDTLNKELPYTRQVLTEFIDDPIIAITPELITKIKTSDKFFEKTFGTSRRNFIDRWVREARGERKGN